MRYDGASWTAEVSGVRDSLHAIWASDRNNIWVVGDSGSVLHGDGTAWKPADVPRAVAYYAVWGASADDVWFAGSDYAPGGLLVHRKNGVFSSFTAGKNSLYDMWGSGADNIYVVGDKGSLLHYDGTSWKQNDAAGMTRLSSVWGSGPPIRNRLAETIRDFLALHTLCTVVIANER